MSLKNLIKANTSNVFRRVSIKRRLLTTGLFEDDWYDITSDVKTFGKVKQTIDSVRLNKFTFSNVKIVLNNDSGRFNPDTSEFSLWNGYLNQQRTLIKIEAGFLGVEKVKGAKVVTEYPVAMQWDIARYDDSKYLLDSNDGTIFIGVLKDDILIGDDNTVTFNVAPLTSVFSDYAAQNLTGWTSTGMTASRFVEMLRDQQDGFGNYVFRPFFQNTSTGFEIQSTTNVYTNLNTSTAKDVIDKSVWDILEKLSEAENYIPYITKSGVFRFKSRDANTATSSFFYFGNGYFNNEYGHTIKKVSNFGRKPSKYYSRVQVKFINQDTSTSYQTVESTFQVSPSNNPWVLGTQTLNIENYYIPNTATALTIATNIFNDYSSLKYEVDFTSSFIPQLDLLDRFSISYDPKEPEINSLWDQNNWGDDVIDSSLDLYFDSARGDSLVLSGQEFKFLSLEFDLDNLENKYIAREV